mgnify:CR=1 FL=1
MGFFHTIFLFDGFRSVRALPFGNTLRGWVIIKSRLCREAAKVGGGHGPPFEKQFCHEPKKRTALHFRAKAAALRGAETMQHLEEVYAVQCSRGKSKQNRQQVKARRDFQTAGLNGVFGYFCRRGQKYPAPGRGTPLLLDAAALPRHTGRCTPRVLVPLRSTAWASPPTDEQRGCGGSTSLLPALRAASLAEGGRDGETDSRASLRTGSE